jgi:hypothetical protein
MDGMSGTSQFVGESDEARRLTLRVVEQQHLSQLVPRPSVNGAHEYHDPFAVNDQIL